MNMTNGKKARKPADSRVLCAKKKRGVLTGINYIGKEMLSPVATSPEKSQASPKKSYCKTGLLLKRNKRDSLSLSASRWHVKREREKKQGMRSRYWSHSMERSGPSVRLPSVFFSPCFIYLYPDWLRKMLRYSA